MKKRKFSDIELDIIRLSVQNNIKPDSIVEHLAECGYIRSINTIIKKIWAMNLLYPDRVKLKLAKSEKAKQKSQYHNRKPTEEERGRLIGYHPNHTEKWQSALTLSGAKCIDFHGTKIYTINGKPVTAYDIMKFIPAQPGLPR